MEEDETVTFQKGTRVITQGEPAEQAYVILKGRVRVLMDNEGEDVELAELGPGEIFGESSLFNDCEYGASIEALEDCQVDVIPKDIFQQKLERTEPLIKSMFYLLVERQRKTNDALLEIVRRSQS